MYRYGTQSLAHLQTLNPALQALCLELILHRDTKILCGYRGREAQEAAFAAGLSTCRWGQSKHNLSPSLAVDLAPYPVPAWDDEQAFLAFGWWVLGVACGMNIPLRWGGDWNRNFKAERGEHDLVHFELIEA